MKAMRLMLLVVSVLVGCGQGPRESEPSRGAAPAHSEADEEGGVTYREGKGLEVSDATREILGISLSQVTEGRLPSSVTRTGHVYRHAAGQTPPLGRASLAVDAAEAAEIPVGAPVTVGREQRPGTVIAVRPASAGLAADAEVLVEFADPDHRYGVGSPVSVTIAEKSEEASALIPRTALLETVSGTYVYVPNGRYFFRTPVKVGRRTEEAVVVLDGLYSGDEVVKEPVTALWLAELQALRGGVACADGH